MSVDENDFRREPAFLGGSVKELGMWAGALSFCRRPYAQDLSGVDVAVVGVPYDWATTGRPGARLGPRAVREASAHLAWERAWPSPFDPFAELNVVDWGDVFFDQGQHAAVPERIEAAFASIIAQGAAPMMLGGDHFCTYPVLKALAAKHGAPLSLIQFDAHSDTWPDDQWSGSGTRRIDHGTMFWHAAREGLVDPAASVQIGLRTTNDAPMGFNILDGNAVQRLAPEEAAAKVRAIVGDKPCYLTFDIDGLDPAFAPGTGTPVCGGMSPWWAKECIRHLQGIHLIGMDVVEVAPAYDVSQITALAAATLALEMICTHAVARKPSLRSAS
ncbi:MAG: agmatinase [Neomegalonema sp.]|nr:agmatinase [Neomegalonema sp.]